MTLRSSDGRLTTNTRIINTPLQDTTELSNLTKSALNYLGAMPTLQELLASFNNSATNGLSSKSATRSAASLSTALEELFRNITISMMNSDHLLPSVQGFKASQWTNVTFPQQQNFFLYSPGRLWLAYGTAIACSTFAVTAGLWSIIADGVYYSQTFSTIFRFSRGSELGCEILSKDFNGAEPLPKYLALARVRMRKQPDRVHADQDNDIPLTQSGNQSDATSIEREDSLDGS